MKTAPTNAATAGWVLVPVEPTEAMLGHGWTVATTYDDIADVERIYRAMLKAVPTPSPDEWPEIWEDPAGKGYPCFRRPMTPAEAKATIDQYAARIVELEAALSSTDGLTREDGWRDIASAPKDGTEFLSVGGTQGRAGQVYPTKWLSPGPYTTENGKNAVGERRFQYPEGYYWAGYDGFVGPVDPTHWRPLPSSPAVGGMMDRIDNGRVPEAPIRVQLSREKGWRMPPNTVSVARPGKWGNPFKILNEEGFPLIVWKDGSGCYNRRDAPFTQWDTVNAEVVALFRERALDGLPNLAQLRGKNLACWCSLDAPCHADVLLELANVGDS